MKIKKEKKRLSLFKKKKEWNWMSCQSSLGEGAGTASHVVSAWKEKLDAAVRSRIVWELKHAEFGGGSGICLVVGRIRHRQCLSKRQIWIL